MTSWYFTLLTESENIAILEAENADLRQRIASLEEKVRLLLELQQKQRVKKDSANSSLPPSSDLIKKTRSLREKSERRVGGQPKHPGHTLEMRAEADRIIELKSNYCGRCGSSLAAGNFIMKAQRQVIELPPLKPIIEEYQAFACQCPNYAYEQQAEFPPLVKAPIQYGSSVSAVAAYFSVYQYIPFQRLKKVFGEIFKLPISEGTLVNLLERAADKSGFVYEAIKTHIRNSRMVGADETGAVVNGEKWWMWVWQKILVP